MLSFIDGELNEQEQAALEQFLENHPQIRHELELLENTRIVPDDSIIFDNKSLLYREETSIPAEYQTLMMEYADNELPDAQVASLKTWLNQHPAALKELEHLQAARLQPDIHIVYPDKGELYRHRSRRMHPAIWWSAAAAVVAGFVIWLLPAGTHQQPPSMVAAVKEADVKPHSLPDTPPASQPSPDQGNNITIAEAVPKKTGTVTLPSRKNNAVLSAHQPVKAPVTAVAQHPAKAEAPTIPQLPPPRNTSDEVVEKHLQQNNNNNTASIAGINNDKPDVNDASGKEALLAVNTPAIKNIAPPPPATAPEPASVKGELIMSVSGSDSKLLDKVTNVAKLFSRRKNK
ncbi:MAG TPA: hypothetical protein VM802_26795 [Chitinophaga sp.]|uniref:anti-sigma factor family protein n=1 Tax=Chitinophaga sp. TaxID=1869181 RepID=UPI002CF29A15|nr:hypothetical protein [Chitinophaga sp.]HVI48505.1 hypothetical protein [Chitinophaga sp.]